MEEVYQLNQKLNTGHKVFIYGLNRVSEKICLRLRRQKIYPAGFFTMENVEEREFLGLPVMGEREVRQDGLPFSLILYDQLAMEAIPEDMENLSGIFMDRLAFQLHVVFPEALFSKVSCDFLYLRNPRLLEGKVVIYGTGDMGHRIFMELLNQEVKVACFCDSSQANMGLMLMNKKVVPLKALQENKEAYHIIIGSTIYFDEIREMLEAEGFRHIYKYE